MSKDKFKKRKEQRRRIRGEMTKRGIVGKEIAARLGIKGSSVSTGCATSPRIVAALLEAGIPAREFEPAAVVRAMALKTEELKEESQSCGG